MITSIKKAYIDLPEGQLHYRYTKSPTPTGPPILFLHKSASSSASYEKLIQHYGSSHNCYAPDMPGFGSSFDVPDTTALTTTWYMNIFIAAFTSLGLFDTKEKVHVVGHHAGACLALEMSVLVPEYVASITLIGASIMTPEERLAMKSVFFAEFNKPVADGSHLIRTWEYLQKMGCSEMGLRQREVLDHARGWRGRNQIYGAVWNQNGMELYMKCEVPIMVLCAKDDVMWEFYHYARELRNDVRTEICGGANFSLDLDVEGVTRFLDDFLTNK